MSLPIDTIICADNCDALGTLPRECIDLVVTSPPYDDLRTYGGHSWDFYGVAWQLKRVLKPGGVIVWVVGDKTEDGNETGTSFRQALHFKEIGLRLHDTMIYRKVDPPPMNHRRYEQEWEYCFVFSSGTPITFNGIKDECLRAGEFVSGGTRRNNSSDELCEAHGGENAVREYKTRGNIWGYQVGFSKSTTDGVAFKHPAVFPEKLARDHILSWSNPGDIVLDPFAGSGTTCKMARLMGRKYIGIEVNPEYVEICKKRLAQQVLDFDAEQQ